MTSATNLSANHEPYSVPSLVAGSSIEGRSSHVGNSVIPPVDAKTGEEFLQCQLPAKEVLVEGLLSRRDQVTFGARRRHGKTTFLMNLAIAGATGEKEFLGHTVERPFRTQLLMLEDDPTELQSKMRLMVGDSDLEGRLRIITREDFYSKNIPIDVRKPAFKNAVTYWAQEHEPDLIVFDNVAQLIGAKYNDPEYVHDLMVFAYRLASIYDAAIVFAAHPKKLNPEFKIQLEDTPEVFMEQIMGSSHLINSTGSLWALERRDDFGHSVFMGGRQRVEGHSQSMFIELDDNQRFRVLNDVQSQLPLVIKTEKRRKAWDLLPDYPQTFGYREAERYISPEFTSSASRHKFISDLKRVGALVPVESKLQKAESVSAAGTSKQASQASHEELSIL